MRVLITGGSGFIGFPIAKRLLEQGHHVRILDIHEPPEHHPHLEFVKKSILDFTKDDVKGCDKVFHLAAILGVDNSDNHPLDTMRINLEGSVHVFRCALDAGVNDIVYSSSSEVYGQPRELPIREDSIKGPVSTYGVSKLAAEIYAQAFAKEKHANIKIVRFFNVYGPRQSVQFVIPIFVRNALEGKPLRIFGEGSQNRCFTFVDDIAAGVLAVSEKGKKGEAYNIGNNRPTTILELATAIKKITGSHSEIIVSGFGPETRLKEREIEYRIPDISKIASLGWKPTTSVEEGIRKIIPFYKK